MFKNIILLLLSLHSISCEKALKRLNSGVNVIYEVRVNDSDVSDLDIKIVMTHLNSDSLKIVPYERDNLLVKRNLKCYDNYGNSLSYRTKLIPISESKSVFGNGYTQYDLHIGKIDTVIVEYTVKIGIKEGNQHTGNSGFTYGYLDEKFGILLGRNVFLVPKVKISNVAVRFDFPKTRKIIAQWSLKNSLYYPATDGQYLIESLLLEPVGIGDFASKSKVICETKVLAYIHQDIPDTVKQKIWENVFSTYEFLAKIFQKPLGKKYFIIFTPKTKNDDFIHVHSWGSGQAMDMPVITPYRWQKFTQNLVRAWTKDAPHRIEYKHKEDFWLADGLAHFLSARILDRLHLQNFDVFLEELSRNYVSYTSHIWSGPDVPSLGALFNSKIPEGFNLNLYIKTLAPIMLDYVDRMIKVNTAGKADVLDVLKLQIEKSNKAKFKHCIEAIVGQKVDDWLDKYLYENHTTIPIDPYTLTSLSPMSLMDVGGQVNTREKYSLTILFTGETRGFIEQCGCKVNQSGGMARRAAFVNSERKRDPNLLLIDLGDAFPIEKNNAVITKLTELEFDAFLQGMQLMKYEFSVVGASELMYSPNFFFKKIKGLKFPYLSANVGFSENEIQHSVAPYLILETHGIKFAFLGLSQKIYHEQFEYIFEENAAYVTFKDPLVIAKKMIPHLKEKADIISVVGRLSPKMIRTLVNTVQGIDLVFSSYPKAIFSNRHLKNDRLVQLNSSYNWHDHNGKLDSTIILYSHSNRFGISKVQLKINAQKRIIEANTEDFYLNESFADDSGVRGLLDDFYESLLTRPDVIGDPYRKIISWDDNKIPNSSFVGVQKCVFCHENQLNQWKYTAHASAFKTLLERQRSSAPKCVTCHVTGLGYVSGYKIGDTNSLLENVQCEMCHGPGSEHVKNPALNNLLISPDYNLCSQCHNQDHSDMTRSNFMEYLSKVVH